MDAIEIDQDTIQINQPQDKIIPMLEATSVWIKESDQPAVFISSADYEDFLAVKVNDALLSENNYTVTHSSTRVELKPAYLQNQEPSQYKLDIVSTTGVATTKFKVKALASQVDSITPTSSQTPNARLELMAEQDSKQETTTNNQPVAKQTKNTTSSNTNNQDLNTKQPVARKLPATGEDSYIPVLSIVVLLTGLSIVSSNYKKEEEY